MISPLLTTSWDDGHPLDFRIAELLAKYNLTGTFYIPRSAPTTTMSPGHVRDLSSSFEIGAHTLDHVFLTDVEIARADEQIAGSKKWVEETIGRECVMFCPPAGRFNRQHIRLMELAGFTGMRTVEFMSLDHPRPRPGESDGLLIMPTTLQARPHNPASYFRNFAKRLAMRNFWLYMLHARSGGWADCVRSLLQATLAQRGVFHLWGHSWEIQEQGQWDRLEYVFRLMNEVSREAPCLSNGQICLRASAGATSLSSASDAA